jgi:hypothetical protein
VSDVEQPERKDDRGYLDVFAVRSFRESHLRGVMDVITHEVENYESPFFTAENKSPGKPYRVVDTERDIAGGSFVLKAIAQKIANAAFTIVILDGLRFNVLFELGFLYGCNKPFCILKHEQWGPSFNELDMAVSDIKGVIVKPYDEASIGQVMRDEIKRCEAAFMANHGSHSVVKLNENLLKREWWIESQDGQPAHDKREDSLVLKSFKSAQLTLNHHVPKTAFFFVRCEMTHPNSAITAYLRVAVKRGSKQPAIWCGYSSSSLTVRPDLRQGHEPWEITVPLELSGVGEYIFCDNIHQMVARRLGLESVDGILITNIRLRGRDNAQCVVKEVMITGS